MKNNARGRLLIPMLCVILLASLFMLPVLALQPALAETEIEVILNDDYLQDEDESLPDDYNLDAPYDLMASFDASAATVELTWHLDSHDYPICTVWRKEYSATNWSRIETTHEHSFSDNATGLKSNVIYDYKVTNGAGESGLASVLRESLALNAPAGLKATSVSPASITVSWTNGNEFDTSARVLYTRTGFSDALEATVKPGTYSLVLDGLAAGTSYDIQVQAFTAYEESEPSPKITVTTAPEATEEEPQPETTPATVVLSFSIGSTEYFNNGESARLDAAPVAVENRTLLPIRFVVEALGGTAAWDPVEKKVTINCNGHEILLWLDNNSASVDGISSQIDPDNPAVVPLAIDERIMMPLRFVGENLDCAVEWNQDTQQAVLTYPDTE